MGWTIAIIGTIGLALFLWALIVRDEQGIY